MECGHKRKFVGPSTDSRYVDPTAVVVDLFASAGVPARLARMLSIAPSLPWENWSSTSPVVMFLARTFYHAKFYPLSVMKVYLCNPSLEAACISDTISVPDDTVDDVDQDLINAVSRSDIDLVTALYERGARNSRFASFPVTTALHTAAQLGSRELVRFILHRGDSPNVQDAMNKNRTPLHVAVHNGELAIVELLLDNRARVDVQDTEGNTPLCMASVADIRHNSAEEMTHVMPVVCPETDAPLSMVAELLLDRGANIHASNVSGLTILHRAALHGAFNAVRELSYRGADVRAFTNAGHDPLYYALLANHVDTTLVLLELRASIETRANIPGYSDIDLAPSLLSPPQPSLVPDQPTYRLSDAWRIQRRNCVQVVLEHERFRRLQPFEAVQQADANEWPTSPRLLRLSLFSLQSEARVQVRSWACRVLAGPEACFAALFSGSGLLRDGEVVRLRQLVGAQGNHSIFFPIRKRLLPYLVDSTLTRATARAILAELRQNTHFRTGSLRGW